ncbi:MAG TPA: HPF/RaiA family ribosome-associated protein [Stellaceae bacterium]|jgi:ribosome-associated translation inhibitor RaiA|nr:HPF/RaiA family ribosome-associated protein [Stellaceae bacterium]
MDVPVEIVFHNMSSSPTIETEIRERVGKLDRLYDHLIGCRVAVELLHRRHKTGNLYDVHIDMRVPGNELAISREPHRAREKFANPDLGVALRDAFRAAERRLIDFKRKQHGEVKLHEADGLLAAQVSQLYPDEDHGFLLTPTGGQLYFHRNSMMNRDFDRLEVGAKVHYVETVGDTGPIANKVWRAEGELG